jgi:hypothetical protein
MSCAPATEAHRGSGPAPLLAVLERLAAADEQTRYVAGPPAGDGWWLLAAALDRANGSNRLDGWFDAVRTGEARGHADVAGSYLASWLAGIVVEPAATALVTERRTWSFGLDQVWVHQHDDGWFDGLAVDGVLRVLRDDPEAGAPGTLTADGIDELRQVLAADIVAVATALFAEIRRLAPVGTGGMWGLLADGVAAAALYHARPGDAVATWSEVCALLDELAAHVPALRVRPRLFRTEWSGGTEWSSVKGTCCLYYKTFDGRPDVYGDGYCTMCPLRDDRWRDRALRSWLEAGAAS